MVLRAVHLEHSNIFVFEHGGVQRLIVDFHILQPSWHIHGQRWSFRCSHASI